MQKLIFSIITTMLICAQHLSGAARENQNSILSTFAASKSCQFATGALAAGALTTFLNAESSPFGLSFARDRQDAVDGILHLGIAGSSLGLALQGPSEFVPQELHDDYLAFKAQLALITASGEAAHHIFRSIIKSQVLARELPFKDIAQDQLFAIAGSGIGTQIMLYAYRQLLWKRIDRLISCNEKFADLKKILSHLESYKHILPIIAASAASRIIVKKTIDPHLSPLQLLNFNIIETLSFGYRHIAAALMQKGDHGMIHLSMGHNPQFKSLRRGLAWGYTAKFLEKLSRPSQPESSKLIQALITACKVTCMLRLGWLSYTQLEDMGI